MKSSRFGLVLLAAAALCVAAVTYTADAVVSAYYAVKKFTFDLASDAFAAFGAKAETGTGPAVQRVQAKAFQRRIEKRERPVVTSTWRMCPSI